MIESFVSIPYGKGKVINQVKKQNYNIEYVSIPYGKEQHFVLCF